MNHATSQLQPLPVYESQQQETAAIVRHINARFRAQGELSMLEAGCGNSWQLQLPGVQYVLTGVDLNQDALDIRKFEKRDLHEAVLGDLRTVSLDESKFDVIYNSFVLEHIAGAEQVLDNFLRWLRPGGLLILRIPDPRSVYGMLSRVTPFWFHVFYKRRIAGIKTAGKPGYDPFPTIYDAIVSREGIHHWCATNGLLLKEEIGWNYQIGRPGLVSLGVRTFIKALHLFSFGTFADDHVNLTYVIEKSATAKASIEHARVPAGAEVAV